MLCSSNGQTGYQHITIVEHTVLYLQLLIDSAKIWASGENHGGGQVSTVGVCGGGRVRANASLGVTINAQICSRRLLLDRPTEAAFAV